MLRRDLLEQGLHDFDFISSTDGVEEIKRIRNSEVVKRTLYRSRLQKQSILSNIDWMVK